MPVALRKGEIYDRLSKIDPTIIVIDDKVKQAVRELTMHVGILNMMPDAALHATERQFVMPLHYAANGINIIPHFISLDGIERDDGSKKQGDMNYKKYVEENYITFDQAKTDGLDALIITGANFIGSDLRTAGFYEPLTEVVKWSQSDEGPTSTLNSCLATHAYMSIIHNVERKKMHEKLWGVYGHEVKNEKHPLTRGMDSFFYIPHSRWNKITEQQFKDAGMNILIDSKKAGVHMATSPDGLRSVCWQGHTEYEKISLLLEWTRDLGLTQDRRLSGEPIDLPEFPYNYLKGKGASLAEEHRKKVEQGEYFNQIKKGTLSPAIRNKIADNTPNRWTSSHRALISNWMGAVHSKTNIDRHKPFMDGVNPDDVFNLNNN